jgi:threonine synthase
VTAVSDQEALQSQLLLAKEGIFAQPAAAISIAAIQKLRKAKVLNKQSRCVAIVTGSGLKYTSILKKHKFSSFLSTMDSLKKMIVSKFEQ